MFSRRCARICDRQGAVYGSGRYIFFHICSAPYKILSIQIVISGRLLKSLYPNLIHITCIVHALHNVCETIRNEFEILNDFVSKTKQFFLKNPTRIQLFKDMVPGVSLPPAPVITRWGTWLKAITYYSEHFDDVLRVRHRQIKSKLMQTQ